jgi:hypothetical protein
MGRNEFRNDSSRFADDLENALIDVYFEESGGKTGLGYKG